MITESRHPGERFFPIRPFTRVEVSVAESSSRQSRILKFHHRPAGLTKCGNRLFFAPRMVRTDTKLFRSAIQAIRLLAQWLNYHPAWETALRNSIICIDDASSWMDPYLDLNARYRGLALLIIMRPTQRSIVSRIAARSRQRGHGFYAEWVAAMSTGYAN